jgi:hypothetical protein
VRACFKAALVALAVCGSQQGCGQHDAKRQKSESESVGGGVEIHGMALLEHFDAWRCNGGSGSRPRTMDAMTPCALLYPGGSRRVCALANAATHWHRMSVSNPSIEGYRGPARRHAALRDGTTQRRFMYVDA